MEIYGGAPMKSEKKEGGGEAQARTEKLLLSMLELGSRHQSNRRGSHRGRGILSRGRLSKDAWRVSEVTDSKGRTQQKDPAKSRTEIRER